MIKYSRMKPLLGTFVEIGSSQDLTFTDPAIEAAFDVIRCVHDKLSFHEPESELSKLNSLPYVTLQLSSLTVVALRLARGMTRASKGLFNFATGGRLVRLGILPNHGGPEPLDFGDWTDLELRGHHARLLRPVRLCLDGIAKGYAVDLAIKTLKRFGLENAFVNAGGDLRTYGNVDLPIRCRSFDGRNDWTGFFRDGAMATSWTQQEIDPRFPSVIVSPFNQLESGTWTVTAKSAWLADSLTKVAGTAPSSVRRNLVSDLGGDLTTFQNSPI